MDSNQEVFQDLTERQIQLFRVDAALRAKILKYLKGVETSILGLLAESDLSVGRENRLKGVLKEVRATISDIYITIDDTLTIDLTKLAEVESLGLARLLQGDSVGVTLQVTHLSAARLTSIAKETMINGAPSSDWWLRQSGDLINKFQDSMRQGMIMGETNSQLIQRVRGTRSLGFTNGLMNTSRNDAEILVRSSVQAVANEARLSLFEANNHLIESYKHVSTLDSRTSPQCVVRDGLRWDAETKKPIGHSIPFQRPPIHWGCRSTIVAELKGVKPFKGFRSSDEGEISASKTFKDFLEGKSKAYQDELLGKGKAELWRKGKISLRQLLDQTGNPLTLEELKRKYT